MEAVGVAQSVLITGGHGLLGSWLVAALVARGHRVVTIRRDEAAVSALDVLGLAERIDVVRGDICDEGLIARTLNEYDVESVFHRLAGRCDPVHQSLRRRRHEPQPPGAGGGGGAGGRPLAGHPLRRLAGWAPAVSLNEGLRRTLAWYREHPQALGLRL